MPRTTKKETRRRLRDAVVATAVERGFASLSVADVVREAKVSAGTIYVHFTDKDEMLADLFMEIKGEFHERLMAARSQKTSAAKISRMWEEMFRFVAERPKDLLFLENGASAGILRPEQEVEAAGMAQEIRDILRDGVEDGTLAKVDVDILSLLLIAPALQLARTAAISGKPLQQRKLDMAYERIWLAIRAEPMSG